MWQVGFGLLTAPLKAQACSPQCHATLPAIADGPRVMEPKASQALRPVTSQILSLENWKYQVSPCRPICPAHSASLLLRGAWAWSAPFGYPVKRRNSPSNLQTSRGNVNTARSCTLDPPHWILHIRADQKRKRRGHVAQGERRGEQRGKERQR